MSKKNGMSRKVIKHLNEDVKESRESIKEDKSLKSKIKKALEKSNDLKKRQK